MIKHKILLSLLTAILLLSFDSCKSRESYSLYRGSVLHGSKTPSVTGRIIEMETGEPISEAKIRIGSVESISDYNGVYLMENVPVGTICVKTYALGYVRSYSDSIKIEPNTLVLLDFVLSKMVPATDKIEVAQNARANKSLNLTARLRACSYNAGGNGSMFFQFLCITN